MNGQNEEGPIKPREFGTTDFIAEGRHLWAVARKIVAEDNVVGIYIDDDNGNTTLVKPDGLWTLFSGRTAAAGIDALKDQYAEKLVPETVTDGLFQLVGLATIVEGMAQAEGHTKIAVALVVIRDELAGLFTPVTE